MDSQRGDLTQVPEWVVKFRETGPVCLSVNQNRLEIVSSGRLADHMGRSVASAYVLSEVLWGRGQEPAGAAEVMTPVHRGTKCDRHSRELAGVRAMEILKSTLFP